MMFLVQFLQCRPRPRQGILCLTQRVIGCGEGLLGVAACGLQLQGGYPALRAALHPAATLGDHFCRISGELGHLFRQAFDRRGRIDANLGSAIQFLLRRLEAGIDVRCLNLPVYPRLPGGLLLGLQFSQDGPARAHLVLGMSP